jgi:hypothetical protein
MDYKRLKRLLNQVVIVGNTKKTFWRRSKKFELHIYYTPVKNKIMIITIDGVDIDHPRLFINFTVGDKASFVFDWALKYEHEIIFQRNRLEN